MIKPEFHEFLVDNGYFNIRELPDGTVAGLYRLIFTTSIATGSDEFGWAYRWCFADPEVAASELAKLESMDDEPTGYIARRGGRG